MCDKWNQRFLKKAKEYSTWSKDPSSKIGAVAIDPVTRRELSGGYNGFPRGIVDTDERLLNRDVKLKLVVHAEANLIYNATRSGISLQCSHLYVWGLPVCSECAKAVIQVGVSKVFIPESSVERREHWKQSWETSKEFFNEAGVEYEVIKGI